MQRGLGINSLLACLLIAFSGCSPVSTITVMQHSDLPQTSFLAEAAKCQIFADKTTLGADSGWSWRIGLYELHNADAAREVQVWRCLSGRGWQPVLQIIGPTRASTHDFRQALYSCLAGTQLVRLVPEQLSGNALLSIIERIQASSGQFGSGTAAVTCLRQRQWRIVRDAGFMVPGRDPVAHSTILPPVNEDIADKFIEEGPRLLHDSGQGIHWRKAVPTRAIAGGNQFAVEKIDVSNRGSFADALATIAALNRGKADGRSDWRLPWIDEAQSLANYLAWTGLGNSPAKNSPLVGLIWTGEQTGDGTPLAVDMDTGTVIALGGEGMYCALILPVAGHGWHTGVRSFRQP